MTWKNLCYVFVFLSEGVTAWLYLSDLFNKKRSEIATALSYVLTYVLLFVGALYWNSNTNALAFCAANLFLIFWNYKSSIREAFLHVALLCFLMAGSEVLAALLFDACGYGFSAHIDNLPLLFSQIFLSKLLYFVLALLCSHLFSPHKSMEQNSGQMLFFCLMPMLSAGIAVLFVYFGTSTGAFSGRSVMMLMTMAALLAVNLLFLLLYRYVEKVNQENLVLQLNAQKERADLHYYRTLQRQYENQRILIHDIKKHLNTIDAMAIQCGANQIDSYISSIHGSIASQSQAKLCSDPLLNFLLLQFREECLQAGVRLLCDVREDISSFMDAASITTLYGNLLSNALEAAAEEKDGQIELSVTKNTLQSVVVLSVINSCGKKPMADGNGGFRTMKKTKELHGVGLQSIARVVKKYDGVSTMYFDPEKKQFHHIVQLPIPQNDG